MTLHQVDPATLWYGFSLSNFRLQRIEGISEPLLAVIENAVLNNATKILNKLPGSRIYFSTILSFLSTFDRLQFYYYHNQNFSSYSKLLLSTINTFALEKGSVVQNFISNCDSSLCVTAN